mmetsp:Transcript_34507/g.75317  ORF Transcript_34507/g.75317 Transcript_34507/m.75317 type:complete len:100 (+) Transcript_34507:61-360(+)
MVLSAHLPKAVAIQLVWLLFRRLGVIAMQFEKQPLHEHTLFASLNSTELSTVVEPSAEAMFGVTVKADVHHELAVNKTVEHWKFRTAMYGPRSRQIADI